MEIVPVTDEVRARPSFQALRRAWPELVFHDAVSNAHWGRLYSERPEFQFALVDGERVLGEGNSLPVPELPPGWRDAFLAGFGKREPAMLCALAVLVDPDLQGQGLSRVLLEHMRSLAAPWRTLVAPVRPTLKERYPLTPIDRYAQWRRPDELLFDPWLRTHERLGAELIGIAPESLVVEGSVTDFEEWTAMSFPESGEYVVPGALVPIVVDRERDLGRYAEPNVWMRHSVG